MSRALHRHCKSVGSIPAGRPIDDSFFATVPGFNLSCVWFHSKLRSYEALRFIHMQTCSELKNDLIRQFPCVQEDAVATVLLSLARLE